MFLDFFSFKRTPRGGAVIGHLLQRTMPQKSIVAHRYACVRPSVAKTLPRTHSIVSEIDTSLSRNVRLL